MLMAAQDMKWRRWGKWLESGMYGPVIQERLEESEGGCFGAKHLEIGRSPRQALEQAMRQYVMVDGAEPKLFFWEKNGELATCVLEGGVKDALKWLHEGHGHFAT